MSDDENVVSEKLTNSIRLSDKSNINCMICYEKYPDAVFMDCGHGGLCYKCSLDIWKQS